MDKTIDNRQESLLWWLGGIIDGGEGCITIGYQMTKKGKDPHFTPLITIVNTNNKILIDKCIEILEANKIPFYVSFTSATRKQKEKWKIWIRGIKRCARALPILSRYIIVKREEATLVKEFCDLRLSRPRKSMMAYSGNRFNDKKSPHINKVNAPYYKREWEIMIRIAEIHNRNPQRLYAELSKYPFADEDIVRTCGKPQEV